MIRRSCQNSIVTDYCTYMQRWGENKMTINISADYVSFEYIAFRKVDKN